jgi:hypothetical protein
MYEMVETNVLSMLVRVSVFSKQELALELLRSRGARFGSGRQAGIQPLTAPLWGQGALLLSLFDASSLSESLQIR